MQNAGEVLYVRPMRKITKHFPFLVKTIPAEFHFDRRFGNNLHLRPTENRKATRARHHAARKNDLKRLFNWRTEVRVSNQYEPYCKEFIPCNRSFSWRGTVTSKLSSQRNTAQKYWESIQNPLTWLLTEHAQRRKNSENAHTEKTLELQVIELPQRAWTAPIVFAFKKKQYLQILRQLRKAKCGNKAWIVPYLTDGLVHRFSWRGLNIFNNWRKQKIMINRNWERRWKWNRIHVSPSADTIHLHVILTTEWLWNFWRSYGSPIGNRKVTYCPDLFRWHSYMLQITDEHIHHTAKALTLSSNIGVTFKIKICHFS